MEKLMDLNKETARRLWVQQFGKTQWAYDFTGRKIVKAAYNDRNSDYGWNVDHILPQTRGGKTADHNLICCHILTNDEKADRFPCFVANGIEFEIQKSQNHYEIISRNYRETDKKQNEQTVNFLDSAQGLNFWESCGEVHHSKQPVHIGYIQIFMHLCENPPDFLKKYKSFLIELFQTKDVVTEDEWRNAYHKREPAQATVLYLPEYGYCRPASLVVLVDIDDEDKVKDLLDDCITLNTYNKYFVSKELVYRLSMVYGVEEYENRLSLNTVLDSIFQKGDPVSEDGYDPQPASYLSIDSYIKNHTHALQIYEETCDGELDEIDGFFAFNIRLKKLASNLEKISKL